jgi:hypothetical protein
VIETVGESTWAHSLAALRPGGTVVVAGATSGAMPPAELNRIFFRSLRVIGSTMGTRTELEVLQRFVVDRHVTPVIAAVRPFEELPEAIRALAEGRTRGKEIVRVRTRLAGMANALANQLPPTPRPSRPPHLRVQLVGAPSRWSPTTRGCRDRGPRRDRQPGRGDRGGHFLSFGFRPSGGRGG